MRIQPRSTRRTTAAQSSLDKENQKDHDQSSQRGSITPTSSRKARHRLSTTELARLEDVFGKQTHPSRQQKKDLAAELGMDYKTVTIWFQNKRQTSKRGQPPPVERPSDGNPGRTRADSCLRSVSSPSLNATLDASVVQTSSENIGLGDGPNTTTAKPAIVAIMPLLDTSNAMTPRSKEHSEPMDAKDKAPNIEDIDADQSRVLSELTITSAEVNDRDQMAEQEPTKGRSPKWKRMRTLEWACERLAKRRKLAREGGYARHESEEVQDGDSDDARMDSALSLLSLASSTQGRPPKDVMRGASLLLNFKHSWFRK